MSTYNKKSQGSKIFQIDIPFTMLPNFFLDEHLFKLKGAAVKIYLIITRKLIGWGKESDCISYSQFEKMTGLSTKAISEAIKELKEKSLINTVVTGTGKATKISYSLCGVKIIRGSIENNIVEMKAKEFTNESNTVKSKAINQNNIVKSKETKENLNLKKEEDKEDPATEVELSNNAYQENNDTSSFSDLKVILKNYGLTDNQIKRVTTEFDEPYIKNKIKQLEFLKKHHPEKIDGEGRYLYNSIIGKWDDQDFKNYIENQMKSSQDSQKQIVRQKIQNEEESMKKEYERQQEIFASDITERLTNEENDEIDKYIDSLLQSPFYRDNKIIYDIAFRAKKIEYILTHYTKFLTFEDFVTQKNSSLKMAA